MSLTLTKYCGVIEGCKDTNENEIISQFDIKTAKINGEKELACKNGYGVVSCGIITASGKFSKAEPKDSTTCRCESFNDDELECQAYCISSESEISFKTREFNDLNNYHLENIKLSSFEIECPNSTKPINCNSYPTRRSNFYPTEKGCKVSVTEGPDNYNDYKWTVSCAKNVVDYELLHRFGQGSFSVDCSPNNVPLGCGIQYKDSDLKDAEPLAWAYINEGRGCQCVIGDGFSATCYAVCGKIYQPS